MSRVNHLRTDVNGIEGSGPKERARCSVAAWPKDGYMPAGAARAYLRDVPDAELHLIEDAGHWLLETHLQEAASLMRDFLSRTHAP